jgi:predicted lysophospholipase L1 biosynthesis ABC-type transport system permease subunit
MSRLWALVKKIVRFLAGLQGPAWYFIFALTFALGIAILSSWVYDRVLSHTEKARDLIIRKLE